MTNLSPEDPAGKRPTARLATRALERTFALAMDGTMCGIMNLLQLRLRDHTCSRHELQSYLSACSALSREDFYRTPPAVGRHLQTGWLEWDTPILSGFFENDRPRVRVHWGARGPSGPTVLLLHALMSASDFGYLKVARWFNERGWNTVFPHLPFHYSRTPRGYLNGELAVTANLIRNGETIRQGVIELRQLMAMLRQGGCTEFGILGTSFGGWNGALLSLLEADFRFVALIQPIVNIEHALWQNPGALSLRRLLRSRGILPGESSCHAHLSSPLHGVPICACDRIVITAGMYDRVSPATELFNLKQSWPGAKLLEVRQGHFGYRALRETLREIENFL